MYLLSHASVSKVASDLFCLIVINTTAVICGKHTPSKYIAYNMYP